MIENNNIPKHWQIKKLGDVFTIERGGSPRPIEEYITENENGINWIKIGDTKNVVKYILHTKEKIKPEGVKRSRMVYPDDFLLSNSMSFGKPFILKTIGCIHDGWLVIRKNETIDNNYLYYILSSSLVYQQFSNLAKGSTVKNLNIEAVKQVEIKFPHLSEQQAIVSKIEEIFSELENGKQQLQTAQQQLKIYRQSLLKAAFEGRLTNKNVNGELPKGWKWIKVSELCNVVRGGSPRPAGDPKYYDGGIPFLKVRDITKDSGVYLTTFEYTIKEAGLHKTRQINPNTLLLSNSGATLGVPKICMIEATMNDGIAAFLDLDQRSNLYLYYFWSSKTKELRNINMGAAQPNLNTDIIKNYLVPHCSFEEQQIIVSELESKLTVCDKLEETITQNLQQAETLRQSILKRAFEGRLI